VDEDPLFVGSPLKRERSINNHLNWSGIIHEARAFFRILLTRGEINVNNKVETAQLIRKHLPELKELFPEAYVEWSEKKQRDELPKLHLTINELEKTKTQNPFNTYSGNRRF
jgi:DNA-directed RNA polymerase alpha subunit